MTAKQKERLGRGLSALIKDAAVGAEGAIQEIEIAQIKLERVNLDAVLSPKHSLNLSNRSKLREYFNLC